MELSSRQWSILSALMVLVAIGILYMAVFSPSRDKTLLSPEGMQIESVTILAPTEQLKAYRSATTVIISPAVGANGTGDGALTNAANLPIILASANDQNAVQMIRELDASGQLSDCLTNFGNPKTLATLDAPVCQGFLAGNVTTLVLRIDAAPAGQTSDKAVLSEHAIDFQIVRRANADRLVFGVLKGVYPNAEQVLANANQFLNQNKSTIGSAKN